MKLRLLPLLACPVCAGELKFSELERYSSEADIEAGLLRCASCKQEYPVQDSIPCLLPSSQLDRRMFRTQTSFAWEWMRYPGTLPEDKGIFLMETQISERDWAGRVVLDAGCGMGRYASVALALGAEAVAFDLSDSLRRLLPAARVEKKLHLVQGDLAHPPFKRGAFDIVYSQGVLHHTPDAAAAAAALAGLVKKGGYLTAWVYGSAGSYRSFSTNPLRPGRTWLKRILPLVWLVVWVRQILSALCRSVTTRIPVRCLYALCYPLAALGAVPGLKYLTFSVHPSFRVRLLGNFDWLAPPFQSKHTKEEVRSWFETAGFEVLGLLPHGVVPKVGLLGRKLS